MERNHRRDADGEQAAERVGGVARNLDAAPEHDEIEKQQERRSDEAELFADDGEDEVRVVLRQKVQLALRSVEEPFAKEHTRPDGDFRLDDVVAGAQRIDIRIHEDHDAHFLIIFEKMPEHRHGGKSGRKDSSEQPQSDSRNENHAEENRHEDERGAEIRLLQNEQERHADVGCNRQQVMQRIEMADAFLHHAREADDHDELREL